MRRSVADSLQLVNLAQPWLNCVTTPGVTVSRLHRYRMCFANAYNPHARYRLCRTLDIPRRPRRLPCPPTHLWVIPQDL